MQIVQRIGVWITFGSVPHPAATAVPVPLPIVSAWLPTEPLSLPAVAVLDQAVVYWIQTPAIKHRGFEFGVSQVLLVVPESVDLFLLA